MEYLVPIFICAIMPIVIVLIVYIQKMQANKVRANVIIKAIESNAKVDVDKLAESLNTPQYTPEQSQSRKLLRGCIFSLIGLVLSIFGIVVSFIPGSYSEDALEILICGCIVMAVGISFLIVYFVNRNERREKQENSLK